MRRSRRLRRLLVLVPVAVALVVVAVAVISTRGSGRADASPIPRAQAFSLPSVVAGGPAAGLPAAPGRTTVVTFFAAWCAPCVKELPLIEAASQRPGAPPVVGIDVIDQRPDALSLLKNAGVTFPAGDDHDGSVSARWGVVGLPVTVLVGADGRILDYHRGELRKAQVDALFRQASA